MIHDYCSIFLTPKPIFETDTFDILINEIKIARQYKKVKGIRTQTQVLLERSKLSRKYEKAKRMKQNVENVPLLGFVLKIGAKRVLKRVSSQILPKTKKKPKELK